MKFVRSLYFVTKKGSSSVRRRALILHSGLRTYFIKKSVDAVKYGTSCTSLKSGNRGGNQAPNSDAYILFTQALKAGGFTPEQLRLISNALQQSRLLVVESVGTES